MQKKHYSHAECHVINVAGDVLQTSQTETYTIYNGNPINDNDWQ